MLSTHNFVSENGFFVIGKVLSLFYSPVDSRGYNYYGVRVKRTEVRMRLDKYLKVSRLIKRRTVANEACDAGRILVNDKVAKASLNIKPGDIIEIQFGNRNTKVEVLRVEETYKKEEAKELYRNL